MNTITADITPSAVGKTEKILKRFIRAAHTRGYEDAKYTIGEPFVERTRRGVFGAWLTDDGYRRMVVTVTVDMPELSDDWEVIATLEPSMQGAQAHESDAIIHMNPTLDDGEDTFFHHVPTRFLDECDHCKSGKRGRKKTMWIRPTGKDSNYLNVGSSCMMEYTAIDPLFIERIIRVKDLMNTHDCDTSGTLWEDEYEIGTFSTLIAAWLEANTTYSRGLGSRLFGASAVCEVDDIWWLGYVASTKRGNEFMKLETVGGIHGVNANSAIEWVNDEVYSLHDVVWSEDVEKKAGKLVEYMLNLGGHNSFEHNVRTIAKAGAVQRKHANIIGGSVAGWLRNLPKKISDKQEYAKDFFLPVGNKPKYNMALPCKVVFVRTMNGAYGPVTLTKMVTPSNYLLVWWRSGNHADYKAGDTMDVKAMTIKKHDKYNETYQTTVTRVGVA